MIQTRRVGALSGEVTRLSSELVGTRAALVAYEGRLATVREVVGDLSQRLGKLDELVRRDPLAPPESAAPTQRAGPARRAVALRVPARAAARHPASLACGSLRASLALSDPAGTAG